LRLWHEKLIPYLDNQRLLGQHRECSALRGLGWGKKHATVNYVFTYKPARLFEYHYKVMMEMKNRGFNISPEWLNAFYRGKRSESWSYNDFGLYKGTSPIYPEHDEDYMQECLLNLEGKGIQIIFYN